MHTLLIVLAVLVALFLVLFLLGACAAAGKADRPSEQMRERDGFSSTGSSFRGYRGQLRGRYRF